MYRKYFFGDLKLLCIIGSIFILAIISGSGYCGIMSGEKSIEMEEYLVSFLNNSSSVNRYNTAIGAIKEFSVMFFVLLISAFFKAGVVFNIAVLAKRGFVLGFTLSSFFKVFGIKGVLAIMAMLPELLLFIPALLLFSSNSTKMAISSTEMRKKFLFFFIIFSFLLGTIFCASGFLNGYITTTFMKYVSVKTL